VTIVYGKYISDPTTSIVVSYSQTSGSSIADCKSVCEQDSKCVFTNFLQGTCFHFNLQNGVEKAAISELPHYDIDNAAYAIKQ